MPNTNTQTAPRQMHTIKCCDLDGDTAAKLFELLNPREVELQRRGFVGGVDEIRGIITDVAPDQLLYPEGWYYAKGCLRNKHTSTTGLYYEIPMLTSRHQSWRELASYCTLV